MAMMRDERRAAILSELDRTGSVKVSELADLLGASTVTVRSDLVALEHDGKLRRTHGGRCRCRARSRCPCRTAA